MFSILFRGPEDPNNYIKSSKWSWLLFTKDTLCILHFYRSQTGKAKVYLQAVFVVWRTWMHQVVSGYKTLYYYLQCFVANLMIWIIIHVQCIVYSGNEAAPTLCFDLWIMHQEVKLKRLCAFIWTLLLIDRNRPGWSMCACCQALDYINDALSRWKETIINSDKQG